MTHETCHRGPPGSVGLAVSLRAGEAGSRGSRPWTGRAAGSLGHMLLSPSTRWT